MPDIALINGRFFPLSKAKVSVEDRGFQFGDGVYELVRTYGGHPFHLTEHLARLSLSAEMLQLPNPYPREKWIRYILQGVKRSRYPDAKIYIQLTRGVAPRAHGFPVRTRPTVVMTFRSFLPLPKGIRERGVSVITVPDLRWSKCSAKSLNLLPNVLAKEEARKRGAFEAIFIRDGEVMEGGTSNVFIRQGETLLTPPEGPHILSGITRGILLGMAKEVGIEAIERTIRREDLETADEIFLTGTTLEVLPVIRVNQHRIGTGAPGEMSRLLQARYRLAVGR